jgi:nucleolar complex protein 3
LKDDSLEKTRKVKKNKLDDLKPLQSTLKITDIQDMLEVSEEEEEENVNNPVESDYSDNGDNSASSDDSENEEITEKLELTQREKNRELKNSSKNFKELLPIKTKSGVVPRSVETDNNNGRVTQPIPEESDEEDVREEVQEIEPPAKKKKFLTATELLGEREQEFNYQKFRIGKICSAITERPEERISSFRTLLELVQDFKNDKKDRNLVSVRKLAMLSIMEAFKDIIPDYKLGVTDLQNQKVKKDTLSRVTFENELLKYYKKYLCQLEASAKALKPGKYAKRPSKEEIYMAEIAVQCLCELLLAHTYTNFSTNIAQVLVIYLNCYNGTVRKMINETFIKLFKTDKRLDLTRHVVRNINQLVKRKSNSVFTEVISCLLALQIKSINPEAEKEEELKRKKMEQQKSKLISMSKRERKRKKKLADLEKGNWNQKS